MTPDCFFLHEDDWGMIDLQPRENLAAAQTTVSEAREHGETHRAPDGLGYTAVYVAPEPQLPLSARALSLSTLSELLGRGWQRLASVTSGYSTYREELPRAFAFTDGTSVLYGHHREGLVETLHLHRPSAHPTLIATLHSLGVTLRLILQDLWCDAVIDLADRAALTGYLQAGDEAE